MGTYLSCRSRAFRSSSVSTGSFFGTNLRFRSVAATINSFPKLRYTISTLFLEGKFSSAAGDSIFRTRGVLVPVLRGVVVASVVLAPPAAAEKMSVERTAAVDSNGWAVNDSFLEGIGS